MEDFVRKEILPTPMDPTVDDVKAFAKEKGIAESDLSEKMIERLKDIVRQNDRDQKIEKYVAENLVKNPIKVAFEGPRFFVKAPEFGNDVPQWGKDNGPAMVFLGHWSCKNCDGPLKSFLDAKTALGLKTQGHLHLFFSPSRSGSSHECRSLALCERATSRCFFGSLLKI